MRTKNRYYLSFLEYGKRQLYGRAAETVQTTRSIRPQEAGLASSTSTKTE